MARFLGLDIGARTVRAALIRTAYRRVSVERLEEVPIANPEAVSSAITTAASHLLPHADGIATAVGGEHAFVHRITLPATAARQLDEVLPFEIEANVPVDIADLVHDHRLLARSGSQAPLVVLAAAARTEDVRAQIELCRAALGREPDRVSCGSMALANLASVAPTLRGPGPLALLDLGGRRTEVTLLEGGEPVMVRTLSRGVEGLPESAPRLAAELRQTLLAFAAHGGAEVQAVYLAGGGSLAEGAQRYLAYELGVAVEPLPALQVDGVTPEIESALPRFAKAVALALGAAGRGRDVDLRRGPLAFQRGYGFLKDKVPLLVGLGAATLVSFLFATWADVRALSRENEALVAELGQATKLTFGEEAADATEAQALLEKATTVEEADPLPRMDAFDVIVELSKVVPTTVTHDIEDFDMQRGRVKIQGVVGSASEAQAIATDIDKHECIQEAKIAKINKAINSEREKYVLEFLVECAKEGKEKGKDDEKKTESEGEP